MAILQDNIEVQIEALLASTAGLKLEESKNKFKTDLAKIIVDAIKSATITIQPGIVVVAGSPSTQTNAAPILIENSIT
jgi:hypothetical protein